MEPHSRMNSIHGCVLIGEDWLPWQTLVLMIMAASFSLHWVEQMNLTISTPSLERLQGIQYTTCCG
ncbi:CWC27 spliceosome associated cyclophilin [Rhinolophus ferrumequinum]|uniref:CWC27 spliceosome associated cyclophilin n=1 Tax=Rhinolophus ferrumequinum TaxID=59479 RepID=A0A7J7Y4R1_RHIFE|nr:CWC27 spliceosome associated cyclophilin [Rhinolophus ferrumequinum]